jgi:Flp pilus assembly protein TadD
VELNIGNVLLRAGRLPEARVAFSNAIELDPQRSEAKLNLGIVEAQLGQYDDAEKRFLDVLKSEPGNESAVQNLEVVRAQRAAARRQQTAPMPK